MLHIAHSFRRVHRHSHRIEVIKLVIVFFFCELVWLSSAWDILEDARFFPPLHTAAVRWCVWEHINELSQG